jgi:hypothetical protein
MMVHDDTQKFTLDDDHRDFLHRCAISDEIIDGRPYYSLSVESRVHLASRWNISNDALRGDGIVIPRYTPDGVETFPQIRYTPPRKILGEMGEEDEQKYTCPAGSGGVIDVHPGAWKRAQDASEPLIFAESIKGADALLSAGILAAGFHGVWGWKLDGTPSLQLRKIPLGGRDVGVCFDADTVTRPDLRKALKEFSGVLAIMGARVTVFELPRSIGEKAGIDDYMAVLDAAGEARYPGEKEGD